ncbi:MAG TPA: EAL domain-containing protein, partial [Acidimicrobiales bacterium]
ELRPAPHAVYVSPSAEAVCGYSPSEVYADGGLLLGIIHPDDADEVGARIMAGSSAQPLLFRWIHKQGHVIFVELRHRLEYDAEGEPSAVEGFARDVTDRVRAENAVDYAARRDVRTGLANHRVLEEELARLLAPGERTSPIVVVVIQLDRFASVTELVGREAADGLLRVTGERLVHATSEHVVVAKGRDDQFWLVAPALDRDDGDALLRRVAAVFHQPFVVDDRELYLTVSAGARLVAAGYDGTVEHVLADADAALRTAVPSGLRVTARWFDPAFHVDATSRLELDNDLRRAVHDGEITVAYQPQVDMATGRIVALEALARWDRPGHGPVSPAEFIAVAEETGLIANLGDHVLFAAARQVARWRATGVMTDQRVAINVSRRQLGIQDLATWILEVLGAVGLPADVLTIEVTETAVMDAGERAGAELQALADAGVRVSIDDFGTGYSSLTALRSLPVHEVKVDREFVSGVGDGLSSEAICRAVVSLAEGLGLELVAEGVETRNQADSLVALGCKIGQGYLFGHPLTPDEVPAALRSSAG